MPPRIVRVLLKDNGDGTGTYGEFLVNDDDISTFGRPMAELRTGEESHKEKPTGLYLPATMTHRPMYIPGSGAMYAQEMKELAARVTEKNTANAPTESDVAEKAEKWRQRTWDHLQNIKESIRRNPKTVRVNNTEKPAGNIWGPGSTTPAQKD